MTPPTPVMRCLGIAGLTGLAMLALAYGATSEPAPRIRVLWREGVTAEQQAALERDHFLLNGRDRMGEGSVAYDLLDTSRSNIRRLIEDPRVADTNDLDRDTFTVSDGTDSGNERTWVAYRIPGLREASSRRAVILILAICAITGLRREVWTVVRAAGRAAMRARHTWNDHRRAPALSRDIFDALPGAAPADIRPPSRSLLKLGAAALAVMAAGLPIFETWEALAVTAAALAIVFSACRPGLWRLPVALMVVLTIVGIKTALPMADIAEGHNAFLVAGDDEPLERGLPPEIFSNWKSRFDARYPPTDEPPPAYSWRQQKGVPKTVFAVSTDAIWRTAKYSRQVDTIGFRNLAEFRGGFTSDGAYNFWAGDLARDSMPFYVMYELTPQTAGSRLRWMGQVFWERSDGTFEELVHEEVAERAIQPQDAGRRVYAAFFPGRDAPFEFHLVPSLPLRIAAWADAFLSLLGICVVVALLVRPHWPDYVRAASISLVAYYVAIALFGTPSSGRLGALYYPHGGGSDGLVHESYGREMALVARQGAIVEAFKGVEEVYWFTPGTRYIRFAEKLVFGDTNHLFALALAVIPVVFFYLIRRIVGTLPAWLLTAIFCVVPLDNLSFLQYVMNARAGYSDGIGAGVFLLGLVLLLHHQPGTSDRRLACVWTGGAALALSMFIRPNFAFAVVWVGAVYAWLSWGRKDVRAVAAVAAGLALALWMPFHNWYYGGELYLISRSGATISVPLGVRDYAAAVRDAVQGNTDSASVTATRAQLEGWLWSGGFAFEGSSPTVDRTARLLRLMALAVTVWVLLTSAVTRRAGRNELALISGAALWAHVPMLFIFSTYHRYAVLAWDLSIVVLIVWLLRPQRSIQS